MDNVRPFARKLASVVNIESQDVVSTTPSIVPPPEVLEQIEKLVAQDAAPAVNEEPALVIPLSVIRALGFYALQGADGGEIGRLALASVGFKVIQEIPGKGTVVPLQMVQTPVGA